MTQLIISVERLRQKYGGWATKIINSAHELGPSIDVSGLSSDAIRERISKLPAGEPACLIGGYDIIPPFVRPNPTFHLSSDDDAAIATDAPYGAAPGNSAQEFVPGRAISRIPDGGDVDAAGFLKVLSFQKLALTMKVPPGSFKEGAADFTGAVNWVESQLPGDDGPKLISPPKDIKEEGLPSLLTRKGRVFIVLHGTNRSPEWAYLFGHAPEGDAWPKALSARIIDLCDMRGCIITFGSCYAAMLDVGESEALARNERNQVSLAFLGQGAKVAIGATRSNWIQTTEPYDGFGPGVIGTFWQKLRGGKTGAAEALRLAKREYMAHVLKNHKGDLPYAQKTVLQMQCYGHPDMKYDA